MNTRNIHTLADIAHIGNGPNGEANAPRRLVACRNACEGIDTDDLEADKTQFLQAFRDRADLKEQRDELAKALRMLKKWVDAEAVHYDANTPDDFILEAIENALKYVPDIQATFAKAEGGAA